MEVDIKELHEIENTLKVIIEAIAPDRNQLELTEVYKRVKEVLEYNALKGKKTRSLISIMAFKMFSKAMNKTVTEEEMQISRVLGWILEILQAFALIMDDLMDQSITRRGQICWHKKVGTQSAIMDARLLEQEAHHILRIFLSNKSYYTEIMTAIDETMRITTYGQLMDMLTNRPNQRPNIELYTSAKLETIYKYKTSYYTFVLPVKFAMILSSLDKSYFTKIDQILLKMGHLFQMQDDFLDCFGNPTITGKIGTDIEYGKCCWPVVTALQLCNETQRQVLKDNYGLNSDESIKAVKRIYNEMNLIHIYSESEGVLYKEIIDFIDEFESENRIIANMFRHIIEKLNKRKK